MADAKYTLHNPPPPPERRPLTPPPPPQGRRTPPPPPTTSPGHKAPPPPPQQHAILRPPSPPQDNREIDWRTIVALAAIALIVASAYGGYSYWKYTQGLLPREDETRAKLVAMLPAYVKVDTLKVKSTDATTFQYEATVSPLEGLYASEVKRPDLGEAGSAPSILNPPPPPSPITLLKRTSKQGEPLLVYGKILANKSDDLWHVSDVTIDSGLDQLGRPRSAFIADATVEGTPEATAAVAKLDKATTDYKSAIQALIAQQATQTEKEHQEALAIAEKARQDALAKAQAAQAQLDAAIKAGNPSQPAVAPVNVASAPGSPDQTSDLESLADTLHVTAQEYILARKAQGEPSFVARGEPQSWAATSKKEVTGRAQLNKSISFLVGVSGRGRINIDLTDSTYPDGRHVHAQDDFFTGECSLSYNYTGDTDGECKIEIKVWITRPAKQGNYSPPTQPVQSPLTNGLKDSFGSKQNTTPVTGQPWTNSLGVKFVPAGTDGVLFSVWDVRVKDFKAFVDATGYDATGGIYEIGSDDKQLSDSWKSPGFTQCEDHPVVGVNWGDAKAFCQWLTKKEQVEGGLASNQKYRLPTDAEWSKAVGLNESRGGAPAGKSLKIRGYPWGTQWPPPQGAGNYAGSEARDAQWPSNLRTIADYDDGYPRTSPAGSFSANKYGLYDMSGNVCQWCEDKYDDEHDWRVLRGASWVNNDPNDLRSSYRIPVEPSIRNGVYGFRVVVVISP